MKREYPEMPVVASAAIVKRDNMILVIRRAFNPNKGKWSIPGGVIELGEPAREAARREVFEETGLNVTIEGIADVVDNIIGDEERVKYHFVNCDFEASYVSGEVKISKEVADFAWIGEKDMKRYDLTPGAACVLKLVFERMKRQKQNPFVTLTMPSNNR